MFSSKTNKAQSANLTGPKLRIEIADQGDTLTITEFEGYKETEHKFPCRVNNTQAREYRDELAESLEKVKHQIKAARKVGELTVADADKALKELYTCGLSLTWKIFRNSHIEIGELFRKAHPLWATDSEPVFITIVAKLHQFVPLEFLPLFSVTEWETCDDLASLETAVRRFPGFSAIIRREFKELEQSQDLILNNEPKLPLKCFVASELKGTAVEVGFFKRNRNHIDVDGPWPTASLPQFAKLLFAHLQNEKKRFSGGARVPSDQIHHFICHCVVNEKLSVNSYLKLSKKNVATIRDLQARLPVAGQRPQGEFGPLVFLNACGTSRIDPMAVTSFPLFFLEDVKSRGFIGTEANVPDLLAAEFSQSFYRGLLNGLALGIAIHEAKWEMLRLHKNPLGILYTIYANPDLRVSNRVGSVR